MRREEIPAAPPCDASQAGIQRRAEVLGPAAAGTHPFECPECGETMFGAIRCLVCPQCRYEERTR